MNNTIHKTSICSIVFLDIIDYSKKPDSEQIDIKNQFNDLINHSLKDVAHDDRIILDTGDGAAIAHMGSPEDALFVALAIRDAILKSNILSATPLYVRFGINLGPVRVVSDINGQPNIIGDGINVAQRIMSFANPNQILVSRSYYDVTSRLTQEITQLFDYSGIKRDKHEREHEVYSVRLGHQSADSKSNLQSTEHMAFLNKINWKYSVSGLLILVALFTLVKFSVLPVPSEPAIFSAKPTVAHDSMPAVTLSTPAKSTNEGLMPNETIESLPPEATQSANNNDEVTKPKNTSQATTKAKEKSVWDTFTDSVKQGADKKCTQVEISMGQCK
jgi:hypothetical protein